MEMHSMDISGLGNRGFGEAARARVAVALAAAVLLAAVSGGGVSAATQSYTIQAAIMTVYEDGAVTAEFYIAVDPISPTVNFSLPGTTYLDVTAIGGSGLPLGYQNYQGMVAVNTLGESSVRLGYTTHDLTSKTGSYWSLNFTSPSAVRLSFPYGASVISVNRVPDAIEGTGGSAVILMPEGAVSVSYILSIVGTADYAIVAIADAEGTIASLNASGIANPAAAALLGQAKAAFDLGNYASAEELAEQAKSSALNANATAYQASAMQAEASAAISEAEAEGRTSGLDAARSLLSEAELAYASGDYASALSRASQAKAAAEAALDMAGSILPYAAIGAVAAAGAGGVFALTRRKRGGGAKAVKPYARERREVDVEKIASEDRLRDEDIDVVMALADSGGEALESEIRSRLNLPKTTLWRAAKRLEREGYIKIETVAGQNRLSVREEYCKGSAGQA